MKRQYVVWIDREVGSDWGVSFPIFRVAWQSGRPSMQHCGELRGPSNYTCVGCAKMELEFHLRGNVQ